ncbi:MAG: DUF1015 family protein [Victivallales bacterium]|nr:DUF1015 family protein [Victivallales bacterium]MCF7888907.1 DUF1015 family protein [Victivallales bacterium]
MSDIQPFKGYVPNPDYAEQVASLPYDVLSSAEARTIAEKNPHSFLHVVKPEIDLPEETDVHSEKVYLKGAENLEKLIVNEDLIRCKKECFYIYRQQMGHIVQTGLVAGASVEEYDNNIIKKHEFTRKEKEDDRVRHVNTLNANTGPVFLTYHHRDDIDAVVKEITSGDPYVDFTADDDIKHTLWIVEDDNICGKIQKLFSEIPALYVADGHHRSAAASRVHAMRKSGNSNHTGYESYNYFLSVIFPDNQLYVMDYNRVLKDLNGLSSDEFMDKIKSVFDVKELSVPDAQEAKPTKRTEFAMFFNNKWYRLNVKDGLVPENDPVKSLDVAILQDKILGPVLGIDDPRTNNRIDFIGGIRGLKELERRCNLDCKVGFALYPTGMDQLMDIADAGEVMPPKSTWFEPKLRSGMVVRMLD